MDVPDDAPADCPVCERAYDSVSVHDEGVMVNLLDNERYRRVCFEPATRDGRSVLRFYHHTHAQAGSDVTDHGGKTVADDPNRDVSPGSEPGD